MGKPVGVYSAKEYHTKYSLTALDKVKESIDFLDSNFDMMIIEGAGSPAEVNLKANDIVNMRIAKMTKAPVSWWCYCIYCGYIRIARTRRTRSY